MRSVSHSLLLAALLFLPLTGSAGEEEDALDFEDSMLEEELLYPEWFQLSSGDLRDDLQEAVAEGKQGIFIYFGQKRCSYCEQFIETTLGTPDIEKYILENFAVIAIDIWGIDEITDTDGKSYTERELSVKYGTNFTPSLIFYDAQGNKVHRLRGFHPPYKFRAALKYVVEKFYQKETFRDYLARAEPGLFFYEDGMNERDFFTPPPYDLDRSRQEGDKPLVVFFERGNCHACDLLHTGPFNDERIIKELEQMDAMQLNIASDTGITTPDGEKMTATEWADKLEIFHTPTLIFFDQKGREILRIDSIVKFYRAWGVLDYINKRGYLTQPDYQSWRLAQRKVSEPEPEDSKSSD
ncbi:MAG: thioredoxin fold domain-containing protein [Pseudomonadota bacterium]